MLKRSYFKRKPIDYSKLQEKRKKKAISAKIKGVKKLSKKGYYKELLDENKWINKIPFGSHGSSPLQKRLWKLVTDYVRIRDFKLGCISCGKKTEHWSELQGGHYRPYTKCKGYTKFDYRNVFAQCAYCNSRMNDDKFEGGRIFAENIIKRYGQERLDLINSFTTGSPVKIEIPKLIEMAQEMMCKINELEEKPSYAKE